MKMPKDNDKVFVDSNLNPEKTVDIKSLSSKGSGKSNTHVKILPSNYKGTLPELKTPCINTRILSVIKTAPVSQNAILPEGYELTVDPIRLVKSESKEEILPCFVVIKYRFKDMSSNDEFVNVAWYRDSNWNEIEVSKKTIADSRDIVNLSNKGLPVTSTNAKMVVDYLFEYESTNIRNIPLLFCSSQLGWNKEKGCYLYGKTLLESQYESEFRDLSFSSSDVGEDQYADGFVSKGNFDVWVKMAKQISNFDYVYLTLMTSLTAPFIQVLEAPNFVLDLCGESSTGKSTALCIAASAWGNPVLNGPNSIINTWNATPVFLDRRASISNGIPLIIDDTKSANKENTISDFIYSFTTGCSKGRGSIAGTQQSFRFSTILITSGEKSIVDIASKHGGVAARVLSLWGAPFGDGDNSSLVNGVKQIINENYGHVGPRVVQFILNNYADRDLWKAAYNESIVFWNMQFKGGIANRLAKNIALLTVVIPLVHAAIPELQTVRPIREMFKCLLPAVTKSAEQGDQALEALKKAWEFFVTNKEKFWGTNESNSMEIRKEPSQGWAGRWSKKHNYIGFTNIALCNILGDDQVATMVRIWKDRGWLVTSSRKGLQINVRIGKMPIGLYRLSLTKIESILNLDTEFGTEFQAELKHESDNRICTSINDDIIDF